MNEVLFSSKKEDWETPQDLFDELNSEFNFTVDVASSDDNYKVKKHYTKKENGLLQNWDDEVVWCNPPYRKRSGQVGRKSIFKQSSNCNVITC